MVRSHYTLKLTDLKGEGVVSHYGKQEFNLNVLHLFLGPGDYTLNIE